MRESPIIRGEKSYGMEDMTKVELKVMSNKHDVSSIMKRCDVLFKNFEDEKQGRTSNTLFLCRYVGVSKGSNKLSFDILPFETNCSMNNLFFEEKEKVMNYIHFFEQNKNWYQERGRPYTLGICTHGPPGCGKTSFEKALCVFLKRHLIIVDFEKVKTEEELQALFFSEYIGPYRIPNEKRLYVFPDIDKTTDILYRPEFQSLKNEGTSPVNTVEKLLLNRIQNNTDASEKNTETEFQNQTRIINLSQILNIFDGLLERTGQIFIMSANHPEKLDPAIIRPGRVDCTIHFKEFSTTLLETFINSFFQKKEFISHSFFETYHKQLHFRYCPSKLFELCVECHQNHLVLEKLLLNSTS
jgi:SpoVK/Ycf46/Vps4 family AAA+-type ATPase